MTKLTNTNNNNINDDDKNNSNSNTNNNSNSNNNNDNNKSYIIILFNRKGFNKGEGRYNESEVLTSRLIDRPLRPMFEKSYRNET